MSVIGRWFLRDFVYLKSRDLGVRRQAAALPCDDTRVGKIVRTDVVALPAQLR